MEARWFRRVGPGIVAIGAVLLVASTTTGSRGSDWRPVACDGIARRFQPLEIGPSVAALESLGTRTKNACGRRQRFCVFCAGQLEPRFRRWREKGEEPVELVGKRGERRHRADGAGRAVLGPPELPAQAAPLIQSYKLYARSPTASVFDVPSVIFAIRTPPRGNATPPPWAGDLNTG